MANQDSQDGKPPPTPNVPYGEQPPADWKRWARITVWVVVALLAAIFVLANSQPVQINFIFSTATAPLYVALIVAIILGILIGGGGGWLLSRSRRKKKAADPPKKK